METSCVLHTGEDQLGKERQGVSTLHVAPLTFQRNAHSRPPSFRFMRGLQLVLGSPVTLALIVLFAAIIRGIVYLSDRSLIIDEAFISLNLQRHSAGELLGELDWNQAAPAAFLEIEKLLTSGFGNSEYVLRAAPFGASLLALVFFAMLAQRILQAHVVPIAVLVFAGIVLTITYAAIAKPYSFDVVVLLALFLSTLTVLRDDKGRMPVVGLAVLGAIAPLFSYASVFAIAASATVLVFDAVVKKSREKWMRTAFVVCGWFILLVCTYIARRSTLSDLRRSLSRDNVDSLSSLRNAMGNLRQMLGVSAQSNGLGWVFATVAASCAVLLIVLGLFQLARTQWRVALLVGLPGLFALVASAIGWYPFLPRTTLFMAPIFAILIAEGFMALFHSGKSIIARSSVVVLLALLITAEAASTVRAMETVRPDDGIKPITMYVAEHQRPEDTVYISFASQYPLAHYLECRCADASVRRAARSGLWNVVPTPGSADQWSPALKSRTSRFRIAMFRGYGLRGTLDDFAEFPRHGRVWVIFSALRPDERRTLVGRLDHQGKRLWAYRKGRGPMAFSAYLYAF
jgi:hypothetical protein